MKSIEKLGCVGYGCLSLIIGLVIVIISTGGFVQIITIFN